MEVGTQVKIQSQKHTVLAAIIKGDQPSRSWMLGLAPPLISWKYIQDTVNSARSTILETKNKTHLHNGVKMLVVSGIMQCC